MYGALRATHLYAHTDCLPAKSAVRIKCSAGAHSLGRKSPQTPRTWISLLANSTCCAPLPRRKKRLRKEGETKDERGLRTERIYVRVSTEEVEWIREYAAKAGLTVSEYARKRMMQEPVIEAIPEKVVQMKRDVAGLCNNVNQIARAVYMKTQDPYKAAQDAKWYASQIYAMFKRLIAGGI